MLPFGERNNKKYSTKIKVSTAANNNQGNIPSTAIKNRNKNSTARTENRI
jgi:hypothetical protein